MSDTKLTFTQKEQDFLIAGGQIWAIEEVSPGGWRMIKVSAGDVFVFDAPLHSEERAAGHVFSFASLSEGQDRLAVHHAVPRIPPHSARYWPPLI